MIRLNARSRLLLRRLLWNRPAVASAWLLLGLAVAAFASPVAAALLGLDPTAVDLYHRLAGPSLVHPLGTDELGPYSGRRQTRG